MPWGIHALKLKPEHVIACQSMSEHAFRTWEMYLNTETMTLLGVCGSKSSKLWTICTSRIQGCGFRFRMLPWWYQFVISFMVNITIMSLLLRFRLWSLTFALNLHNTLDHTHICVCVFLLVFCCCYCDVHIGNLLHCCVVVAVQVGIQRLASKDACCVR